MESYKKILKIGIISPISKIDEKHDEKHWKSILNIVKNAFPKEGYEVSLVSDGLGAHYILNTIIDNIYFSDIIICDITLSNPNVMWELGVAMTMNKSIIIIKEDGDRPPFDILGFQYISYSETLKNSAHTKKKFKEKILTTANQLYARSLQENPVLFCLKGVLDEKDKEIRKLRKIISSYEERDDLVYQD